MSGDLSEIIKTFLERNGQFQRILIFLLCLNSITIGINHTITSFHIYVPNFSCKDNINETCEVYINGTECPGGYIFDEDDERSVVVEWSLVCDKRLMAPLVNSLYFVGVTLGALICSTLCDVWGRKQLVFICLYAQAVMAIGLYYSSSLEMFMAFRLVQGFFIQGLQTCSYTLMLEYCPSRYRTAAATFWESCWAVGLGLLGGMAYYIRDWRVLNLAVLAPTLLSLFYSWIFPESITWLYANGKSKDAQKLLCKIAKYNKQTDVITSCNAISLNSAEDREQQESLVENSHRKSPIIMASQEPSEKVGLSSIVRNPVLRKHLLSMIAIWFSVTLSYYGILFFLPSLAGQRHVSFLVGAGIELLAYILAYFVLSSFGRRNPMTFYQYMNAVLLLVMGILCIMDGGTMKEWCLIVITLIAKGLAVSSFCGMFIYCSELFPTVVRGLGLGLCGFSARCGSLLAPQLMALIYYLPEWVPLSVMSVFLLITATATLFLPETLSSQLPNTIAEADEMWGKNK